MGASRWLCARSLVLLLGVTALWGTTAAAAEPPCPNEALRTASSALLPECRAYELTSPIAKNGYDVITDAPRAASSGAGVVFEAQGALPGSSSAGLFNVYLSRPGPSGDAWTSRPLSPPLNPLSFPTNAPFLDWTSNLSAAIVQAAANAPLAPGGEPFAQDLYRRDGETNSYSLISHSTAFLPRPAYGGASSDLSHVVYSDPLPETEDTPATAVNEVYERFGGQTRVVGVLEDGEAAPGGVVLGSGGIGFGIRNAVSSDGSSIAFTTEPSASGPGREIYVRLDGATTVKASASQKTVADPNGAQPAVYWGAASDGSAIFFTSPSALTDDADTGPTDGGNDLYRFDVGSGALVDLSADPSPTDPNGAEVQGVVGMSEDGSRVYFVANGQLDGDKGVAGAPNLYLWHEGVVRFIATLSAADAGADWPNSIEIGGPTIGSRVSADGTEALLTTSSAQPGYDNVDPVSGQPHNEIYRFSATPTASWTCVSCNPSGAAATGDATLSPPPLLPFGNPTPTYLNRALDAVHGSVFFSSQERLTPTDEDDATDAYAWHQGELSLISLGASESPSFFLDADAAGENVYISTRDRLSPEDVDDLTDVYDARVGGGIAAKPSPPGCAEPCRGPISQPGAATGAASSTFVDPHPRAVHRHRHRRHHHPHRKHHHRHVRSGQHG